MLVARRRSLRLEISACNTLNYSNAYWPDASHSGIVLNGITRSQFQKEIGVYNRPRNIESQLRLALGRL